MSTSAPRTTKTVLVAGAVRPWHIVFLIVVAWIVGIVGGFKATQHVDGTIRAELHSIAVQAIMAGIILAFVVVVPELRRSLPLLFARPRPKPAASELALAFAVMLAWGYGLYLVCVCFPILLRHPEQFLALRYGSSVLPFEPKYLIYIFAAAVVAPIGEELVFRGYLLNLWMARLGLWPALTLSTLLFAALHWERAIFALPLGFLFACVYLRYDSLWPGILMHGTYNLLAFPWLLARFFYVKQTESIQHLSAWIPEMVIAVLFIPLFVLFWRRFKPAPS